MKSLLKPLRFKFFNIYLYEEENTLKDYMKLSNHNFNLEIDSLFH